MRVVGALALATTLASAALCKDDKITISTVISTFDDYGGDCKIHQSQNMIFPPTKKNNPPNKWCKIEPCRQMLEKLVMATRDQTCLVENAQGQQVTVNELYWNIFRKCTSMSGVQDGESDYVNLNRLAMNSGKEDAKVSTPEEETRLALADYTAQKATKASKKKKTKFTKEQRIKIRAAIAKILSEDDLPTTPVKKLKKKVKKTRKKASTKKKLRTKESSSSQ